MQLHWNSQVEALLQRGAHLLINVSGGADSDATLTALWALYQQRQPPYPQPWTGTFTVIHSHLGRNEWQFTLPHIQRYVTELTGAPPVIVSRKKGDLLDRWWQRYHTLQAEGRNVPPWSSSAARFCSGELKSAVIASEIRRRFPHDATVISVLGIRADESVSRSRKPVFSVEKKATAPTKNRHVYRWLPIHDFTLADVWGTLGWTLERLETLRQAVRERVQAGDTATLTAVLNEYKYRWHPAYALGNTRVSCSACVLASRNDLHNGIAWQPDHFRDLVELELTSGFSFQNGQFLADLRPNLLTPDQRERLSGVKAARVTTPTAPPQTQRKSKPQQLRLL